MLPFEEYKGVSQRRSAAQRYVAQVRDHFFTMASAWGMTKTEIEGIALSINPVTDAEGDLGIAWTHSSAPNGSVRLNCPTPGAADLVLRHALASRTNYAAMRRIFDEVRQAATDAGLTLADDADLFGYDLLRCIDTGYSITIVSASGMPQPCPYALFLCAPDANAPKDVSTWSAEEIMRKGFAANRQSVRQLILDALSDAHTPVPSVELRATIKLRYGRAITPRELATVVAKEPTAFGKGNATRSYIVPALDVYGRPVRGWYTRSNWKVPDRIVLADHLDSMRSRARTALARGSLQPLGERASKTLEQAAKSISSLPLRERLFGARDEE